MPDGDYEDRPGDSGSSRRREEEAIEELVQKLSAEAARGTPAKMLQRRAEEDVVTVFRRGGFRLLMLSLMGWVALGAFSVRTVRRVVDGHGLFWFALGSGVHVGCGDGVRGQGAMGVAASR